MVQVENLLTLLGTNIRLGEDESYKGYSLKDRILYMKDLSELANKFKSELAKTAEKEDFFSLMSRISNIQDSLMIYHESEIVSIEPFETGIDLPEVKAWEAQQRKSFRDNGLYFLKEILEYEIFLCRDLKSFVIQVYNEGLPQLGINKSQMQEFGMLERVNFEGEQSTLVGIMYIFSETKRMLYNTENRYASYDKHFTDFLEKNFAFKKGSKYTPVINAKVALSEIRNSSRSTGENSKKQVVQMIDECIDYLSKYKEEVIALNIHHKTRDSRLK